MAALPENLGSSPTVAAIYATYEARAAQERRRGYLGGSQIGHECARALWYSFRWALRPTFDGRILRLFDTGHREEPRILDELRRVGIEVVDADPSTRQQYRFSALGGHLSGGIDGVARGLLEAPKTWHLLEFKTANTKNFKAVKEKGVERANAKHFAQMQLYMGLAELTRAAYIVVCKETDTIHLERVKFDRKVFEGLLERAERIVRSPVPLTRVSQDPFAPPCGFCDFRPVCHEEQVADVNCRTCAHSTPLIDSSDDALWRCDLTGEILTLQAQERGCGEHLFIPPLVPYAEAIDGGEDFVLYQLRKKPEQRFVNAAAGSFPALDVPHFGSRELRAVVPEAIGNEAVEAARDLFGPVTGGSTER